MPLDPEIIYSSTGPILLAIRDQLSVVTELSTDAIKIVGDINPPRMQATQVLQLWPQDISVDEPTDIGHGRIALRITEPLWIAILTQLVVDPIDEAMQAFTDPVLGHYALRNRVFDLHDFWPIDNQGSALTVEPIKLISGRKADKPAAPRFSGWATSVVMFSMIYRQKLTPQTDP